VPFCLLWCIYIVTVIFHDSSCELSCVTIESALRSGLDILVGTPGRILDHMHRGTLNLKSVKYVVYVVENNYLVSTK